MLDTTERAPRHLSGRPVALSNNETPHPPPVTVQAAIRAATTADAHRYPDLGCRALTRALAAHLDVAPDQVIVTAGCGELLLETWNLMAHGSRPGAVFAVPGFPLYDLACARSGLTAARVAVRADGTHDIDAMITAGNDPATGLLVICNPHNPTGTYVTAAELQQVLDNVDPAVLIVVDEAYGPFADAPDFPDTLPLLTAHPNVLVARTFSKAHGLAGLRVGYGVAAPATIAALNRFRVPFTVSVAAQAGALAWLRCLDELPDRLDRIRARRDQLAAGLSARGFRVTPSQANFVYAVGDGQPWENLLREYGVAVRGIGPAIRVTAGNPTDHEALFAAIDQIQRPSRS